MSEKTSALKAATLDSEQLPATAKLMRWTNILGGIVAVLMLINLYNIFIYVPTEKSMGIVQRIFYFHAPSAITAFVAFTVTFVYSVLFLARHRLWHDRVAYCAAEVGVLLTTIVLTTGPIWARPVWNTWWSWDPRLTTTLVLWFIYAGYLMLRNFTGEEQRGARFAAVFAIVGFVDVPIVYMANRLWRTLHPQPVILGGSGSGLEPTMRYAFLFSIVTFICLFVFFLLLRLRLERTRLEAEGIKREMAFVS
jgi:heme exporter protein C